MRLGLIGTLVALVVALAGCAPPVTLGAPTSSPRELAIAYTGNAGGEVDPVQPCT
jgi:hypothetical protein